MPSEVLGNGALVVLKPVDETRTIGGAFVNPPKLFVLYYDLEYDEARREPISFKAAEALAPEKYAEAMRMLELARRK